MGKQGIKTLLIENKPTTMVNPVVGFNPVSKEAAWKENLGGVMIPQPQLMVKSDLGANPYHYQGQPIKALQVPKLPSLFAYFPECQYSFLEYDPKYFLIRYKRKHKRRNTNRQNNVWVHPSNNNGPANSGKFHGGNHKDVLGNLMPNRITEWVIPNNTKAFQSIELNGFDIEKWYGINASGTSQFYKLPVAESQWSNNPTLYSLTGQNLSKRRPHKLKELRFRVAINIRSPFAQDPQDRMMGPMSDIFTIAPVMGIFLEGNYYYKWRIKI
jgi:hypothetical protein